MNIQKSRGYIRTENHYEPIQHNYQIRLVAQSCPTQLRFIQLGSA